jgi:hypothetical protein
MLIIAIPTLIAGLIWFVITGSAILANSDHSVNLIATLVQSLQSFIGSIAMMMGGSVGIYRVMKSLGKIR